VVGRNNKIKERMSVHVMNKNGPIRLWGFDIYAQFAYSCHADRLLNTKYTCLGNVYSLFKLRAYRLQMMQQH
jgi:hypothetical protein